MSRICTASGPHVSVAPVYRFKVHPYCAVRPSNAQAVICCRLLSRSSPPHNGVIYSENDSQWSCQCRCLLPTWCEWCRSTGDTLQQTCDLSSIAGKLVSTRTVVSGHYAHSPCGRAVTMGGQMSSTSRRVNCRCATDVTGTVPDVRFWAARSGDRIALKDVWWSGAPWSLIDGLDWGRLLARHPLTATFYHRSCLNSDVSDYPSAENAPSLTLTPTLTTPIDSAVLTNVTCFELKVITIDISLWCHY